VRGILEKWRFNSSVGILVVRTRLPRPRPAATYRFQFLGRNSGRSDVTVALSANAVGKFQFLGRNSGRSDFSSIQWMKANPAGFNSSVGILVVRTILRCRRLARVLRGFNSSVGILVVRTILRLLAFVFQAKFQFLGRNSGRSDYAPQRRLVGEPGVSIPRSEFWSFGRPEFRPRN